MMPQLENAVYCRKFVLPKIVTSFYNKMDGNSLDGAEGKEAIRMEVPDKNEANKKSPEITCSPSPCVYDDCTQGTRHGRLSTSRSPMGSRSPSPDPRRRRSPSPSPMNNNRRRGSVTPTGYEMYQKSLLEVPVIHDYCEASSDDLSSEWDSDAQEAPRRRYSKV